MPDHVAASRRITDARLRSLGNLLLTWGPLIALSVAVFWFSSRPGFGRPDTLTRLLTSLFGESDWFARYYGGVLALNAASSWMAHLVEFALLALSAFWAIHRQWLSLRNPYWPAFAYAALFALSDEVHQYFVPGRHCDWRDVLTDWAGAALALALVALYRRTRSR